MTPKPMTQLRAATLVWAALSLPAIVTVILAAAIATHVVTRAVDRAAARVIDTTTAAGRTCLAEMDTLHRAARTGTSATVTALDLAREEATAEAVRQERQLAALLAEVQGTRAAVGIVTHRSWCAVETVP